MKHCKFAKLLGIWLSLGNLREINTLQYMVLSVWNSWEVF